MSKSSMAGLPDTILSFKPIRYRLFAALIFCCLSVNGLHSQEDFTTAGAFQKALKDLEREGCPPVVSVFESIPYGDSLFFLSNLLRAECMMIEESYERAFAIANDMLEYTNDWMSDFCRVALMAAVELGEGEKVTKTYNYCVANWPMRHSYYTSMAFYHQKNKDYDQALKMIQKSLSLNTANSQIWYRAGNIYEELGFPTLSILAYGIGMGIFPNDQFLNIGMNRVATSPPGVPSTEYSTVSNPFAQTDQLVRSRVALRSRERPLMRIDHPINRQMDLIFKNYINKQEVENDPFTEWLVNSYSELIATKLHEVLLSQIMFPQDPQRAGSWQGANRTRVEIFPDFFINQLRRLLMEVLPEDLERAPAGSQANFEEWLYISSIGEYEDEKKNGPWIYLNPRGIIGAYGNYESGKETGIWEYYNTSGLLAATEKHAGDDSVYLTIFNPIGKKIVEGWVVNEKRSGLWKEYFGCGQLHIESQYKNGNKHGSETHYYADGSILSAGKYHEGLETDTFQTWHDNGQRSSFGTYKMGKAQGTLEVFYRNGTLQSKYSMSDGKFNGDFQNFYPNGQLADTGSYSEDKPIGIWKRYYHNGKIKEEFEYDNSGNPQGEKRYFNMEGILSTVFHYRRGRIVKVVNFDRDGNEICSYGARSGNFFFKIKHLCGRESRNGNFHRGLLEGEIRMYYPNGKISLRSNFSGDKLSGLSRQYYINGNMMSVLNMKEDQLHGTFVNYNLKGDTIATGIYLNDQPDGLWKEWYHTTGQIKQKSFYQNGNLNGYYDLFRPDGNTFGRWEYMSGFLLSEIRYNKEAEAFADLSFSLSADTVRIAGRSGSPMKFREMSCGINHGTFIDYFSTGEIEAKYHYTFGIKEGPLRRYYPNGNLQTEFFFIQDQLNGTYTSFFPNGAEKIACNYQFGELEGDYLMNHDNGMPYIKSQYWEGVEFGIRKLYNRSGEVAIEMRFDEGGLQEYRSPDGKWQKFNYDESIEGFFNNGKPSYQRPYEDEVLHGQVKIWYSNGNPAQIEHFDRGYRQGQFLRYYQNGNLLSEGSFNHDEKHGKWNYYRKDGSLERSINFFEGELHGPYREYDETGNIVFEEIFSLNSPEF